MKPKVVPFVDPNHPLFLLPQQWVLCRCLAIEVGFMQAPMDSWCWDVSVLHELNEAFIWTLIWGVVNLAGNSYECIFCSRGNSESSFPGLILVETSWTQTNWNLSLRYDVKTLHQSHSNVHSASVIKISLPHCLKNSHGISSCPWLIQTHPHSPPHNVGLYLYCQNLPFISEL